MASNPLFWTALRYFGGCTFVGYVLLKAITPTDEYMKEVLRLFISSRRAIIGAQM